MKPRSPSEILRDFYGASVAELHRANSAIPREQASEIGVFVLRNITLENAEQVWQAAGLSRGVQIGLSYCEPNGYRQAALDPPPQLLQAKLVVLLLWAEELPAFDKRRGTFSSDQALRELRDTLDDLIARSSATILVATLVAPLGCDDIPEIASEIDLCNAAIRTMVASDPRLALLDVARSRARLGATATDLRSYHRFCAPLGDPLQRVLGMALAQHVCERVGKQKKVLVLDADNTLWGGVLGEDGIDKIALAPSGSPGAAYWCFQRAIKRCQAEGVLLALATKNDLALVQQALAEHPHMILTEADFVCIESGWGPKSDSLRRIATTLNVGLDSFVFIDDSPLECAEIRAALPQVEVLQMPTDAAAIVDLIPRYPGFARGRQTPEDLERTRLYQAEAVRHRERDKHTDLASFLRSLQLEVEIGPPLADEFERLAQLTQRTNQFNTTSRRRDTADLMTIASDPAWEILVVRVIDRYGDYGLTGCAILHHQQDFTLVESFMLSCRVLSRGVEDALLAEVATRAVVRGLPLVAEYAPTAKNGQLQEYFPSRNFDKFPSATPAQRYLKRTLTTEIPDHISLRRRAWKRSTAVSAESCLTS